MKPPSPLTLAAREMKRFGGTRAVQPPCAAPRWQMQSSYTETQLSHGAALANAVVICQDAAVSQLGDLGSQDEVVLRQPVGSVGPEVHLDPAPSHQQIGMVPLCLG